VGTLALMQGGTAVSKDVPPFTVAHQVNEICGLNIIGLRRAGMKAEERLELKRLYRFIFRSGQPFREAIAEAQGQFHSAASKTMLEFLATGKRPVCPHSSSRGHSEADDE
jgi:UDP-N-acetylglucosamine acyltransferase